MVKEKTDLRGFRGSSYLGFKVFGSSWQWYECPVNAGSPGGDQQGRQEGPAERKMVTQKLGKKVI